VVGIAIFLVGMDGVNLCSETTNIFDSGVNWFGCGFFDMRI
jgi:hypothetical protein